MSFKNNWIDKEGRVFIYFTVEEIMRRRNISKPTAIKTLDELDMKKGIGLIERVMTSTRQTEYHLCQRLYERISGKRK